MTKAGTKLLKAAKEARRIARGETEPAATYIPADIDVRKIRSDVGMSQEAFAQKFGFSVHQIRDWEQGRVRPIQGLRAYLLLIATDPEFVSEALKRSREEAELAAQDDKAIAM